MSLASAPNRAFIQTRPHTKTEIEMTQTTTQKNRHNTAQTLDALLNAIQGPVAAA